MIHRSNLKKTGGVRSWNSRLFRRNSHILSTTLSIESIVKHYGSITSLESGFSLTQADYDLSFAFLRDSELNIGWQEDGYKYEILLLKKSLEGSEIWSGELFRLQVEDMGTVSMVRYKLEDGGSLFIGNWIFGEDNGVYCIELFPLNAKK